MHQSHNVEVFRSKRKIWNAEEVFSKFSGQDTSAKSCLLVFAFDPNSQMAVAMEALISLMIARTDS